ASVPVRASPAAEEERASIPDAILQQAQHIRDEHPVVSRATIEALLPPSKCGGLRQTVIMPMLAYLMDTGPWRNCWIRFVYDPRTDPGSCQYQIQDICSAGSGVSGGRLRPNPRGGLGQPQPDDAPATAANAWGYVFDDDT
ncbi:tau 95 subunit of transcription factor TFIIIC, partial [Coemansia spiralis]